MVHASDFLEGKAPDPIPRPSFKRISLFGCGCLWGWVKNMAVGHNLCRHFGADEHPCATYFDVHQGYRVLTHNMESFGTVPLGLPLVKGDTGQFLVYSFRNINWAAQTDLRSGSQSGDLRVLGMNCLGSPYMIPKVHSLQRPWEPWSKLDMRESVSPRCGRLSKSPTSLPNGEWTTYIFQVAHSLW